VPLRAGIKGELFESITNAKIAKFLQEKGFNVKGENIKLKEPIKEIGKFPVEVEFTKDLKAKIKIEITKHEAEN
jgi:ribosomal protein L9